MQRAFLVTMFYVIKKLEPNFQLNLLVDIARCCSSWPETIQQWLRRDWDNKMALFKLQKESCPLGVRESFSYQTSCQTRKVTLYCKYDWLITEEMKQVSHASEKIEL